MFLEAQEMPMQLDPRQLGNAVERFPTLFKYRTATLGAVLDEYLSDPCLKALCAALWPYLGTTPERLSFFAYSQFLGVLVDGPSYCQGSFQRLVDAFVAALERDGGELVCNAPVAAISMEGGCVTGVRLDGGRELRAPIVVSNADARHTFHDLLGVEHLPPSYSKRLARLKPSLSACVVYAATSHDLLQYEPAHETFRYKHWDHEETWGDILAGKPGGMSLSIMTMLDPDLAPPGEHVVVLTAIVPYELPGTTWAEHKDRYVDGLLAEFETVFPGLRQHLTHLTVGTPETIEHYTRNYRGAVYGWELTPQQTGSKRLGHAAPVEGLYLSGHWTEEGPASFRVILSGINTARAILTAAGEPDAIPSFKPSDFPGLPV
jgi:prolycopene isomerase